MLEGRVRFGETHMHGRKRPNVSTTIMGGHLNGDSVIETQRGNSRLYREFCAASKIVSRDDFSFKVMCRIRLTARMTIDWQCLDTHIGDQRTLTHSKRYHRKCLCRVLLKILSAHAALAALILYVLSCLISFGQQQGPNTQRTSAIYMCKR
jgi:hypothetical protein